ncbi:hypothetical protein EYR40_008143 [Pleurotus pulmonarius]|nr:hypothetical protein EYR38_007551 [Pleurotus pulmonarius]KAF4597679.1 hypothetical protein EYR40_008143 [Pleurotus pulmonarius]
MHMHIGSPSPSTYSYDTSKSPSHPAYYTQPHALSPGPSIHDPRIPVVQSPYGVAQPHYSPSVRAPQIGNIPLPSDHTGGKPAHRVSGSSAFSLNPALVYNPSGVLYFNLMYPTETIRFKKAAQMPQLSEPATHPCQPRLILRIYNQALQLDSSFAAENPNGLTLYDVLHRIYTWFHTGVSRQEMQAFGSQQRAYLTASFSQRTANNPNEYRAGVKRLDWLGQSTFFFGLSPAPDGSGAWIINVGAQPMA